MRQIFALAIAFFSVFLLLGCAQQQTQQPLGNPGQSLGTSLAEVQIQGMKFVPDYLQISKGTTVKWTNVDSIAHTVTSPGNFDSGILLPGQSYNFTFNNSGAFDYTCNIHPSMKAKVSVS